MSRTALLLLLALVALPGCGGPPVGDAPEAAGGRPGSSLPPNEARNALAGIRPHGGHNGKS